MYVQDVELSISPDCFYESNLLVLKQWLSIIAGLDWWTGLVDWTTGFTNFSHKGVSARLITAQTTSAMQWHKQQQQCSSPKSKAPSWLFEIKPIIATATFLATLYHLQGGTAFCSCCGFVQRMIHFYPQ